MKNRIIRYVAFLRGINVGGVRLIKMDELRRVLESLRLKNVRTFIASGNVVFDSAETNRKTLTAKIERKLMSAFGHDVAVVLMTVDELEETLKRSPFKKIKDSSDVMMIVAFLAGKPQVKAKLPFHSTTENLEVMAITDHAAFILCRRKKNGMFSFPNNFFEKQFAVTATSRQLRTAVKVLAFARSQQ